MPPRTSQRCKATPSLYAPIAQTFVRWKGSIAHLLRVACFLFSQLVGSLLLNAIKRNQAQSSATRRRPRCRRARSSTSGLRSNTESLAPDSGHTDILVRLDINRSPLSRWDDLFYFAKRGSSKITPTRQCRGRRRSAVNNFRFEATDRADQQGPPSVISTSVLQLKAF